MSNAAEDWLNDAEEMPMGIHEGMANAEYHGNSAISKSGLDLVAKSPTHYWYSQEWGRRETAALDIGSLFHDITLMGSTLEEAKKWCDQCYAVAPDVNKRTNAGKQEYAEFLVNARSKTVIQQADFDMCVAMRESVMMNPQSRWLVEQGQAEVSHFWVDEETDAYCRIRPDIACKEHGILGDLKSTPDCTPYSFQKSVYDYRYHVQEAMYRDGYEKTTNIEVQAFWFIAVEKKADRPVTLVYYLQDRDYQQGYELYRRDLESYAEAFNADNWTQPKEITMPNWAFKE